MSIRRPGIFRTANPEHFVRISFPVVLLTDNFQNATRYCGFFPTISGPLFVCSDPFTTQPNCPENVSSNYCKYPLERSALIHVPPGARIRRNRRFYEPCATYSRNSTFSRGTKTVRRTSFTGRPFKLDGTSTRQYKRKCDDRNALFIFITD